MRAALSLALICWVVFAQDAPNPDEVLRALALKRSDVVAVVEPGAFVAPLMANRVKGVVNLNAHEHSADVIVLYEALHGVNDRAMFYAKLHRLLRPGGRVVNIDSPTDAASAAEAVEQFKAAGFRISQTKSSLPNHYVQVFE